MTMPSAYFEAGCYGKLPSMGDFVSHNAGSTELEAFNKWVREGIYFAKTQVGSEWNRIFMDTSSYQFLFRPGGANRFLVGAMIPSQDKSQRMYPFTVSIVVDQLRFGNRPALAIPAIFSEFLGKTNSFIESAFIGGPLNEIVEQVKDLKVPVSFDHDLEMKQYRTYLEMTSLGSFWEKTFADPHDARKFLVFENLREVLKPFKNRTPTHHAPGLRFPLPSMNSHFHYEVTFWLHIMQCLHGHPFEIPVMFWTAPHVTGPRYLFIFFAQPKAKDFLHLLKPELESDTICILEENGLEKGLPDNFKSLLDKHDQMLSQFVDSLSRLG
jgi:type VI secretion system protein ImpM